MAPSRRLGRLVVLCALAAAHEPTEHERLDTDYDYVVKTRSKGPRAPDEGFRTPKIRKRNLGREAPQIWGKSGPVWANLEL